jgi:hypothetical protein
MTPLIVGTDAAYHIRKFARQLLCRIVDVVHGKVMFTETFNSYCNWCTTKGESCGRDDCKISHLGIPKSTVSDKFAFTQVLKAWAM